MTFENHYLLYLLMSKTASLFWSWGCTIYLQRTIVISKEATHPQVFLLQPYCQEPQKSLQGRTVAVLKSVQKVLRSNINLNLSVHHAFPMDFIDKSGEKVPKTLNIVYVFPLVGTNPSTH